MKHTSRFLAILIASIIAFGFAACSKDEDNDAPTCTIVSPTDGEEITQGNTVTISVEAEDDDGSIAEVRFYIDGVGKGSANSFPYNYEWITTEEEIGSHTIKAEAKDNAGATKTDEITVAIVSSGGGGTFTDPRDGKVYQTVTIGNQEWMAENLAYLPSVNMVADGSEDAAGSYYYVYGYDGTNVADAKATGNYATYGVLYNWTAAMNACPDGWHLPTDAEWRELTDYLGKNAGGKLKATGTIKAGTGLWYGSNIGATNETGFTALPGGSRNYGGTFSNIGLNGNWWSATEYGTYDAWYRYMGCGSSLVSRDGSNKELGFSVRCLRD
jgi:uncharacterized protein (TIGR02145 family)